MPKIGFLARDKGAGSACQLRSVPFAQSCTAALSVGDAPFLSHFSGKSLLHSYSPGAG